MVFNPALMNGLGSSVVIFAVAFVTSGLVLVVHRKILPRFGIWIGTEKAPEQRAPPSVL
jgi:hypothetical protein